MSNIKHERVKLITVIRGNTETEIPTFSNDKKYLFIPTVQQNLYINYKGLNEPKLISASYSFSLFWMHLLQNIELKVEVESLKKELQDKQELLDEAVWVTRVTSPHRNLHLNIHKTVYDKHPPLVMGNVTQNHKKTSFPLQFDCFSWVYQHLTASHQASSITSLSQHQLSSVMPEECVWGVKWLRDGNRLLLKGFFSVGPHEGQCGVSPCWLCLYLDSSTCLWGSCLSVRVRSAALVSDWDWKLLT